MFIILAVLQHIHMIFNASIIFTIALLHIIYLNTVHYFHTFSLNLNLLVHRFVISLILRAKQDILIQKISKFPGKSIR